MSKYDELKKLAEVATQGSWGVDRLAVSADTRSLVCCGQAYLECCGNPDVDGDEYDPICSATSEPDAAYIAAANPAAILELIAENERLRLDAERFRFIESDADGGMRRIYGDDWVLVIDENIGLGTSE